MCRIARSGLWRRSLPLVGRSEGLELSPGFRLREAPDGHATLGSWRGMSETRVFIEESGVEWSFGGAQSQGFPVVGRDPYTYGCLEKLWMQYRDHMSSIACRQAPELRSGGLRLVCEGR